MGGNSRTSRVVKPEPELQQYTILNERRRQSDRWNIVELDKKLSCRRQTARCFASLNISISHSLGFQSTRQNAIAYIMQKPQRIRGAARRCAKQTHFYLLSVQCYAWTEHKFTCVCVCVCVCVRHTFCQLAYRTDPSTDFYS